MKNLIFAYIAAAALIFLYLVAIQTPAHTNATNAAYVLRHFGGMIAFPGVLLAAAAWLRHRSRTY